MILTKKKTQAGLILFVLLFSGRLYAQQVQAVDVEMTDEEDRKKYEAANASEVWLALVDEAEYSQSWNDSVEYFQSIVSNEDWVKALSVIREPLGKVQQRKNILVQYHAELPNAPEGEYVLLQYQTDFENKSASIETITMMLDTTGHWKMAGYYIK